MRTTSWILLTIVGALMLLGSVGSASVAYFSPENESIAALKPDADVLPPAVRAQLLARRGTAAAFAGAFATLFLFVVTGPYRRGEVWAWWAVLAALVVLNLLTLPRVSHLGTKLGLGTAGLALGVSVVALLLDVKRLRRA